MPLSKKTPELALTPLIVVPLVVKFPRFVRVKPPLPALVLLIAELPVVTLPRPPPTWENGKPSPKVTTVPVPMLTLLKVWLTPRFTVPEPALVTVFTVPTV